MLRPCCRRSDYIYQIQAAQAGCHVLPQAVDQAALSNPVTKKIDIIEWGGHLIQTRSQRHHLRPGKPLRGPGGAGARRSR